MKFESVPKKSESIPEFIAYRELVNTTPEQDMSLLAHEYASKYGLNNEWQYSEHSSEQPEAYNFASYLYDLGLTIDDLKGRDVLDVGSGGDEFRSVLEKNAITKSCVALDEGRIIQAMDIKGKAEALPFRDESFDMTLAHHSVPVMQATSGNFVLIPATLREMIRVTRKGGTVKIDSIQSSSKYRQEEINQTYRDMGEIVLEELQQLHSENPELQFKIDKVFSHDSHPDSDYHMRLEISKK